MAKSKRQREKSQDEYTSTKNWVETSDAGGFEPTSYVIPEGITKFKWKKGRNKIDVIPFRAGKHNPNADEGKRHWERTYFVHPVPTGSGENKSYCCLQKNWGKKCPICVELAKARRKGEIDDETAKKQEPKMRRLMYVIDRENKSAGTQLLESAHWKSFGELLKDHLEVASDDSPILDFFKLDSGMTLEVNCKEDSFMGRSYLKPSLLQFVERKSQYDDDMIDEIPCLDDVPKQYSYDELLNIYLQGGETDDEDTSKKKKRPKDDDDEDEDEDNEDEDTDEEEEEEEKPKKKKKRKVADEDEDEEEESEDEEEEDDDEEKIEVGDSVTFTNDKGKTKSGTIKKINYGNGVALVLAKGAEKPVAVDIDELTKFDIEVEEEDEEEEDEKPAKKKKKPKKEEEEDEIPFDEDDDEVEDEEDDDSPDDDDDEEEDEDEEEELPKKKKKR